MDILPQLIVNTVIAGSIYSILTLGFNLIFSTSKFVDMGFGALITAGGYGAFFAGKALGLPLLFAIPAGIICSALVSLLAYSLVYAPLRERKASGAVLLIASLGVLFMMQAVIAIIFTSQFQTLSGFLESNRIFEFSGGTFTFVQASIAVLALLLCAAVGLLLKHTLFGKAVIAISDDEEVAKMAGINTHKIIGRVFILAGALGGLGGVLIGLDTGIEPMMGLYWLLFAVTAAIVAGIGNVYAGIAGAFFIAFVENFGIWKIAGEWRSALIFGVLIIFLLWKPRGLFPR